MARLKGVEAKDASLYARSAYWFTKRRFGRVMETLKITAHSTPVLKGVVQMEMAQGKLKSVDHALISLAEIKVATMIGCPF